MPLYNAAELARAVAAGEPRAAATFADHERDAWHNYQEWWLGIFSPGEQQTLVIHPPPGKWVQYDWRAPNEAWDTERTTEHGTRWYLANGERVDRPPGDTRWPSWAFPNPYWAQDTRCFEYTWA